MKTSTIQGNPSALNIESDVHARWIDPGLRWYFDDFAVGGGEFHLIDRACAVILLVLFSPFMLAVAFAIKAFMPGPLLYRQTRVGKNGNLFEVLKFRTMVVNAEESTGHTLSWEGDPELPRLESCLENLTLMNCLN